MPLKMNRQATNWEKIFAKCIGTKNVYPKPRLRDFDNKLTIAEGERCVYVGEGRKWINEEGGFNIYTLLYVK